MSFISGGTINLSAPDPPPALAVDDDDNDNGSNENDNKTEIAIVGAGPSGLLTACLLKKADKTKDVRVFDARERPTSFFGSFPVVLNKRGQTALEKLGPYLIAKVRELGRPVDATDILSGEKTVASVASYGLCIMRDQLVGLLLEVADQMNIPIYWKHKFVSIDIDNRNAVFELEPKGDDDDGQEDPIKTENKIIVPVEQALVGADGNYSRVRRECESTHHLLTVQEWEWGIRMRYLLAPNPKNTALPPTIDGAVHYVLGADGYVCQQPNGDWSMTLSITDESEDFMTSDDPSPENIAKLKAKCQESAAGMFAEHLLTSDEIYASFFQHRVFGGSIIKCSTLAPTDWIALIGDAAHAVAPYTGEGVNSALESASVLAATFCRKTDNNTNNNTCADFDDLRRKDAHALNEYALRNRTIVAGTPSQKCVNTFGTIVLSIGKKTGFVSAIMQDYMGGAKAKDKDPVPYTELIAMDKRQRRLLDPLGLLCFNTIDIFK